LLLPEKTTGGQKKSANHPHPYFIDGAISSGAPSIGNPAFPPIK